MRPDVVLQAKGAQMGLKRERESVSRLGPGHAKVARSEQPLDCDVYELLTSDRDLCRCLVQRWIELMEGAWDLGLEGTKPAFRKMRSRLCNRARQ